MSVELQPLLVSDIEQLAQQTGWDVSQVLKLFDVSKSSYYRWTKGDADEAKTRRVDSRSLLVEEEQAIIEFRKFHHGVGYRKFTYMLIDANVAYAPESAIYRLLKRHNLLGPWYGVDTKDTGKEYQHKPQYVHHHWHTDLAYIKVSGVYYFLIMVLDGYSRFLLNWDLLLDMTTASVKDFIQATKDKYPHAKPKLISDNGPQFIARDFKMLMSRLEIEQIHTRRNHPQTNGKIERMNQSVKREGIRPHSPMSYQEVSCAIEDYEYFYNYQRLHAGIGYLRPADLFFGRDDVIKRERKEKLTTARTWRKLVNQHRRTPTQPPSRSPN